MSRPRVVVTGCAGFIGGHMVERLLSDGYEVTGVDDFSTGRPAIVDLFRSSIRFIEGSLCEPEVAAEAVDGASHIVHLATVPSVPRSVANPRESVFASIVSTVTLMEAAQRAKVRRLVQASSSSIYGNSDVLPRVETIPDAPIAPYAVAKLAQEKYAQAFCHCYGLDSVSLRYFNVFGPRQNPDSEYAAVIPKFVAGMRAGVRPKIFGDGEQTRDFTFVENVVEANLRALLCENPLRGNVANIGNGESISLNRLVELLNNLLGTSIQPEYLPERIGDVKHSRADTSKAKGLFGYSPRVTFAEGLEKTVGTAN